MSEIKKPVASSSAKKVGSNWKNLQSKLPEGNKDKKRTKPSTDAVVASSQRGDSETGKAVSQKATKLEDKMRKLVVGLDCEMVGVGISGKQSCLARCSIVDFDGNVVYDSFVQPKGYVTDFRTKYSGVRKSDIRKDQAPPLEECQKAVADILKDKVLVGHALKNDFNVLFLSHPRMKIRDTSTFKPYMRIRNKYGKLRPRALRDLSLEYLGKKIQDGEHDSIEDARTAVMLYRNKMEEWEESLVEMRKGVKKAPADTETARRDGAAGASRGDADTTSQNNKRKRDFAFDEELSGDGENRATTHTNGKGKRSRSSKRDTR